ncbi:N-6 DNA methylase [Thiotrichales bacterium HSG14]|nr:N-6 DNA methylase [Thiotrichales bacterium HSG14]
MGHIFENSLNEIENVTAQLEGQKIDKSKSKRKKDGVFYTPKYITKYIVENTVGKLCEEKKAEFGIVDEEYAKGRKKRKKAIVKTLYDNLQEYRNWLLKITICDPACGSGAFLNQTLEFLISEHAYIDELQANLLKSSIVFQDVSNHLLEKNIFGVDINEESVDIAKLSLWLRTAQRGRKLTSLNNNIKCGNSLIDDPEVAGEKAFNWKKEFPNVFEKGGFDVVIGNPPYVQLQAMGEMSEILKNRDFRTFHKGADLYCLFTEQGYKLLKEGGLQSFIMPNKWMLVAYGQPLRKFLSKTGLRQMLNFGDIQFFEGATTIVCIFVTEKEKPQDTVEVLSLNQKTYNGDFLSEVSSNLYDYPASNFDEKQWSIQPYADSCKLEKMKQNSTKLKDLPISIYRGILTGFNDAFYINEETRQKLIEADANSEKLIKPMVRGRNIVPYGILDGEFMLNIHNGIKNKKPPLTPINIENYPAIKQHLDAFYPKLEKRGDKGQTPYNLRNCAYIEEFSKQKIIYPNMTSVFPFMYDESGILGNQKCFILTANNSSVSLHFLTALFNSSLAKLWIWYNCPELQGGTREISKVYFEHFPVPNINEEQKNTFEHLTKERIRLTFELQTKTKRFVKRIEINLEFTKLTNKLSNFYDFDFKTFLSELKKQKIKLSLIQQDEWEEYFNAYKTEINSFQNQINQTDKEIDKMVYELYELTPEEIEIVENSVK